MNGAASKTGNAVRVSHLSKLMGLPLAGLILALAFGLPRDSGGADDKAAEKAPPFPLGFSNLDTDGVSHSLRARPERAALVVVFLATECPISNGYLPELNRQFLALRSARPKCRSISSESFPIVR